MAAPTLQIDYNTVAQEVAHFLSFSTLTVADFETDEQTIFDEVLRRGTLRFLYPPPLEPGEPSHEWSFLKKNATLALSNTDFDYDLPDDFGALVPNTFAFQDGDDKRRLRQVDPETLRAAQSKDQQSGTPFYYALRAKDHTPTTGQLWEVLFYPTPDGSMTATYRYVVAPDVMTSTNKYPYGGTLHSNTFLTAVLSVAEERQDDNPGEMYKSFLGNLAASVRIDRELRGTAA